MILVKQILKKFILAAFLTLFFSVKAYSQRYLADIDSSFFIKDTVRPVIKRFENLRITGYIQPQFQKALKTYLLQLHLFQWHLSGKKKEPWDIWFLMEANSQLLTLLSGA